jgi:AcrR family transcriptional regulator
MPRPNQKPVRRPVRDPERTRQRILEAALKEFAAHGFAGARVDAIARQAKSNKRMLYHYFGDKDGLFQAVLQFKLDKRMVRFKSYAVDDMTQVISQLFRQNCEDADWVRLLAWESLQTVDNRVQNEPDRRRRAVFTTKLIRRHQAAGTLKAGMKPEHFQLAMASLAIFPMALPQLTRLITGRPVDDPKFQREYGKFLETISAQFRPSTVAAK